jgi:hypothetical protein
VWYLRLDRGSILSPVAGVGDKILLNNLRFLYKKQDSHVRNEHKVSDFRNTALAVVASLRQGRAAAAAAPWRQRQQRRQGQLFSSGSFDAVCPWSVGVLKTTQKVAVAAVLDGMDSSGPMPSRAC